MVPIAAFDVNTQDDPYCNVCLSVFCSGCNFRCKGCQNEQLQHIKHGRLLYCQEIYIEILKRNPHTLFSSVVFLGGEWLLYKESYYTITKLIKLDKTLQGINIILYTGYTFEDINKSYLQYTDVIIDGTYEEHLPSTYLIPATTNQRVFVQQDVNIFIQVDPLTLPVNQPIPPEEIIPNVKYQDELR